MSESDLIKQLGSPTHRIEDHIQRWALEVNIDKWLHTSVVPGVLLGDALIGDGIGDRIDLDLKNGFSQLMGSKADSFQEIRELIIEKYEKSPASVHGLMNKIQGQIGENFFIDQLKGKAELAQSGNQMGWDIKVNHGEDIQYVQVKVYQDAENLIKKISEVNQKVAEGSLDGIERIDFAVNSEIYMEVVERAKVLGLENEILDLGVSREAIRDLVENGFENARDFHELSHFFGGLLDGVVQGAALHAVVNAFFVWKGAKEVNEALDDTLFNTVVTAGGIAAALGADKIMAVTVGGPIGIVAVTGAGILTRSVLRRVVKRRELAVLLSKDNESLRSIILNLKSC